MNEVIINGVSSNEIRGLLIQELPPIIQPGKRIYQETVDGRAGDIITDLGYDAYDKEMRIGLYRDYDIDTIVRYFSSEGTIIFSNEPGKLYDFKIFDRVDYERLVRYRTANVIIHCQPYKHMADEPSIITTDTEFTIRNRGNITAQPRITVYGSGQVDLYLDDIQMLTFNVDAEYITLDFEEMNAYMGGILKNRQVTGDMSAFHLPIGESVLRFDGTVTEVQVERYNRWI